MLKHLYNYVKYAFRWCFEPEEPLRVALIPVLNAPFAGGKLARVWHIQTTRWGYIGIGHEWYRVSLLEPTQAFYPVQKSSKVNWLQTILKLHCVHCGSLNTKRDNTRNYIGRLCATCGGYTRDSEC